MSVYSLEMDKPHALTRLAQRRPDLFPDSDAAAGQYLTAGRALVGAGYRHYEISNFARPGRESIHNGLYWAGASYLGLGAGAAASGWPRKRSRAGPSVSVEAMEVSTSTAAARSSERCTCTT